MIPLMGLYGWPEFQRGRGSSERRQCCTGLEPCGVSEYLGVSGYLAAPDMAESDMIGRIEPRMVEDLRGMRSEREEERSPELLALAGLSAAELQGSSLFLDQA